MKTDMVFFPFDLFGGGGAAEGVHRVAEAFREILADNRRETVPTRARAYTKKVRLHEAAFETLDDVRGWRERGGALAAEVARATGAPSPSAAAWCSVPRLARSVVSGPAGSPPRSLSVGPEPMNGCPAATGRLQSAARTGAAPAPARASSTMKSRRIGTASTRVESSSWKTIWPPWRNPTSTAAR